MPILIFIGQIDNFLGVQTEAAELALMISALSAAESLLCGAVASNMTGLRLQAKQEPFWQGIGSLLIPFFGGVPVLAAIARTSVVIRPGDCRRRTAPVPVLW